MASTVASAVNAVKRAAVNTFGVDAFTASGGSGLYNRARPSYPDEAIQKVLSLLPNDGKAHVVEVGAGTGIFTANLVAASQAAQKIKNITAVEPSSGMRDAFNKNEGLQSSSERPDMVIKVVDGSFGDIPVPDASVDIIVGAQCFHWAHPNYSSAITEFARVLKPNGTLALIWNLEDRNKAAWVAQIRDAYEAYESDTPQYRLMWWKELFNTAEYKANFAPAEQFDYSTIRTTTEQGVVDRILSKSYITAQSKETQEKIAEDVRSILAKGQDRKWVDQDKGIFEYPYETNLYLMKKK